LKREIFDMGFQTGYEATAEFLPSVERVLASLSPDEIGELTQHWRGRHPTADQASLQSIRSEYALILLEELVARARVASDATRDW
jgi:hypothetical protein